MKAIFIISILFLISSCGTTIKKEDITGCWSVAYIDTDGIKTRGNGYEMCFEENGELITQKKGAKNSVTAEWNLEESDSTIVVHYRGSAMPDTFKIVKAEEEEVHLRLKKGLSSITFYLRKGK